MIGYWNDAYIAAARAAYPHETAGHELAVGFKLTKPDCTSYNGYYWGLVNGDHDAPQMHHVLPHLWNGENIDPCPSADGDGFCFVPQGQPVREATSGSARWASAVGHVLVYAADLAVGWEHKKRAPWVIQVDCFDAAEMLRAFGSASNLSGANLYRARNGEFATWPTGFDWRKAVTA